nr:four-carbon acid sugar kinase family protein [Halomarina sp. PSR21]
MTEETNRPTDDDLLLAFYGDDFTGSTDALEGLAANGVRAVLFLDPPTRADLDRFDDLDALGIAGASRSMTPGEMTEELRPAFEALSAFDVPIVHYKVCSTFDSAPDVGSIGRAIDIGQEMFDSPVVPVSQGTEVPHGRYVAFSNLFAVQDGETYRIDRHPTMRDHPVTPMREGDLRRHLGEQTERDVGHVHVTDLNLLWQRTRRSRTRAPLPRSSSWTRSTPIIWRRSGDSSGTVRSRSRIHCSWSVRPVWNITRSFTRGLNMAESTARSDYTGSASPSTNCSSWQGARRG